MPNALTMTWNRELIAAQFKALGDEYFASGYSFVDGGPVLGPLGRVPEGGRQNEAFSPDVRAYSYCYLLVYVELGDGE